MRTLVFGVHHWGNRPPTHEERGHCNEWYDRITAFVPGVKDVFVATGSYSNPNFSPLPEDVQLVQNNVHFDAPYSRDINYFRNGFMTGIWHALLNEKDWDVLFHIQTRVFMGAPLTDELDQFSTMSGMDVMAPRFAQKIGTSIEISIFAMKPEAVKKYATSGVRQSLNIYGIPDVNCEEEAFIMFNKSWFNPWPDVITTRANDFMEIGDGKFINSPFAITNPEVLNSLPFISANDKHISEPLLEGWKEQHPCPIY